MWFEFGRHRTQHCKYSENRSWGQDSVIQLQKGGHLIGVSWFRTCLRLRDESGASYVALKPN